MKKNRLFLLLIILTAALIALALYFRAGMSSSKLVRQPAKVEKPQLERSKYAGEKIIYEVKYGPVRLGKAEFRHHERVNLNGNLVDMITLETSLSRFSDKEVIYSDPSTHLPLRVEREVKNLFSHENIIEEYDQDKYLLTIVKGKSGKHKITIQKDSAIQNAILLPYYVRDLPDLKPGWNMAVNLPTRRLLIKLSESGEVSVPAGKFETFNFVSDPRQVKIWITSDKRRIPVKIEGSGVLGYTLNMTEYVIPERQQ